MTSRFTKWFERAFVVPLVFANLLASPRVAADTATPKQHIVILKTREIAFYAPALLGFVNGLKSRGYDSRSTIDVRMAALTGKSDADSKLLQSIVEEKPDLIVTLGTDATRLIADQKPTSPVLFSMILDPVSLGLVQSLEAPGGEFTGTTLTVSPGKQLDSLLQSDSKVKRIGVLYTDQDAASLALLADTKADANRLNIKVVALPVTDGQITKDLLDKLKNDVDALWLIPDPASSGPQPLADTLAFAKLQKLPVLGMSSGTVKAGALVALSANLEDLGDITAEMATHILDGTGKPGAMRVRGPRRTFLSINLVTARELKLTIPESVLHLADEVVDSESDDK